MRTDMTKHHECRHAAQLASLSLELAGGTRTMAIRLLINAGRMLAAVMDEPLAIYDPEKDEWTPLDERE